MPNERYATVAYCPLQQEYCQLSCSFRKGNLCYFISKRGRQTPDLQREKDSDESTDKGNLPQVGGAAEQSIRS